jgi:hypothetical protein
MDSEPPIRSATPAKPIRAVLVRCRQCGERIAIEELPRRNLAARVLCVDCSFDDIPHTD